MQRHILLPNIKRDVLMVIDGKYLVYRIRHSRDFKTLSYKEMSTGLLFGFFNTVISLGKKFNPSNTVIMWDVGKVKDSRRREQYEGYKRRRVNLTEEELKLEEDFDKEYINLMEQCYELGFAGYSLDRYEADDLIALFCNKYKKHCQRIINITRDEDIYQCIDQNVDVYSPDDKKKKNYGWFTSTYNIIPKEWSEVKAIGGCTSDTVPGVSGVGTTKAIRYLNNDATDLITERINEACNVIDLYRKLVTLPHDDLAPYNIPYRITDLDIDTFIEFCQKHNFKKFMENLHDWELFRRM